MKLLSLLQDVPRIGRRGPRPGSRLSKLGQRWLKHLRNARGLSNRQLAAALECSVSRIRGVLNGKLPASLSEVEQLVALVSPRLMGLSQNPYAIWLDDLPFGGLSQNGCAAQRHPEGRSPEGLEPRHETVIDYLQLSGKVRNEFAVIRRFADLASAGSSLWTFFLPTASESVVCLLEQSGQGFLEPYRRTHPQYRSVYNIGALQTHCGTRFYVLVARVYVGASRCTCDLHGLVNGSHKLGGFWRHGCQTQSDGKRCPSDHYTRVPRTRCGRCGYSDNDFWKCRACTRLVYPEDCRDCEQLGAKRQHLMIEVTGTGNRIGLLVPLVQHLFARFAIPDSVVREGIDIAHDIELPFRALIPFQKSAPLGKRRYRTVIAHDNGTRVPSGITFSDNRIVFYSKPHEVEYRRSVDFDFAASLPAHMLDWFRGTGTRAEFRDRSKSAAGKPWDLSDIRKDWLNVAYGDLRLIEPHTVEAELLRGAKQFGFVPGRLRPPEVWNSRDSGKKNKRGVVGVLTLREDSARPNEVQASGLEQDIERLLQTIQHPHDIGRAVEARLPSIEAQIRNALRRSKERRLEQGRSTASPSAEIVWNVRKENARLSREADAYFDSHREETLAAPTAIAFR